MQPPSLNLDFNRNFITFSNLQNPGLRKKFRFGQFPLLVAKNLLLYFPTEEQLKPPATMGTQKNETAPALGRSCGPASWDVSGILSYPSRDLDSETIQE